MSEPAKGQAAGPGLEARLAAIEARVADLEAAREWTREIIRHIEMRIDQMEKRA